MWAKGERAWAGLQCSAIWKAGKALVNIRLNGQHRASLIPGASAAGPCAPVPSLDSVQAASRGRQGFRCSLLLNSSSAQGRGGRDWKGLFTCETRTALPGSSHHPWWLQRCPEPSGSSARPPCPFLEAKGGLKPSACRGRGVEEDGAGPLEEVLVGGCGWAHSRERDTKYSSKWPQDNHSQTPQKGTKILLTNYPSCGACQRYPGSNPLPAACITHSDNWAAQTEAGPSP